MARQHFRDFWLMTGIAVFVSAFALLITFVFWPRHFTVEHVTFNTNQVPGTSNSKPVRISASLYLPKNAKPPFSSVVIVPSSGGVEDEREIYYAEALTQKGIAALVVDSFSARGVENSLYDQSLLEAWQVENDAWAALRHLSADPRFDSDRIAVMGVSKGGTVAMDTALSVHRRWAGIGDVSFAAHIAISPDCTWMARSDETTGAPILFLLAGRDDQTPLVPCKDKAARMRDEGNTQIEVRVYPNAHHAWEELGWRPFYDPKVENYSKCRVSVLDDGKMVSADTGESVPEDDWRGWAKQHCMTLGATCCGGSRQQKARATSDIVDFLKRKVLKQS